MSTQATKTPAAPGLTRINKWTPELVQDLEVIISPVKETTNEYTRNISPTSHYWQADVSFKLKDSEGRILRQAGVGIPYNRGATYGEDYAYCTLPRELGDKIAGAATAAGLRCKADDDRLPSTDTAWWKTINNMKDLVGVVLKSGDFENRDLEVLFEQTKMGVRANLDFCVSLKLSKTGPNSEKLEAKDEFRVVIDCSRVSLKEVEVDIEPPPIKARIPQAKAHKDDVAPDSLLDRLATLGI
ncbi:hypothetical protein AC579_10197 [Pseudocercospora musae]|uniref:Uncharacterized protein n=1 Tax=Pseudocercospora musae TaxID=113226 RepID=A0A139I337_9PEZI|nr:hypothetical protein AC579_10197 [Pseudocercospora musae]